MGDSEVLDPPLLVSHSGDWHIWSKKRFDEHIEVLFSLIKKGKELGTQLFLFGGDYGFHAPHRLNPQEMNALVDLFQFAAQDADVVAIPGNHDHLLQLEIFSKIKIKNFHYRGKPDIVDLGYCDVVTMPWLPRGYYVDTEGDSDLNKDENGVISDKISEVINSFKRVEKAKPAILLAHYAVEGAKMGQVEVTTYHDVTIRKNIVEDPYFNLICLSHLHFRQKVGPNAYYPGDPVPLDLSERGRKGFNFFNIRKTNTTCRFIPLKSWGMAVISMSLDEAKIDHSWDAIIATGYSSEQVIEDDTTIYINNSYVRVDISIPNDVNGDLVNFDYLKEKLLKAGARSVTIRLIREGVDNSDRTSIIKSTTEKELLSEILESRGILGERRERIYRIYEDIENGRE